MKKIKQFYDEKYMKIALYCSGTVLLTFILGMIIYHLSGSIGSTFSFFSSFLKPLLIGIVLSYLLSPLVEGIERKLFSKQKNKRLLSVLCTYLLLAILLLGILALLVLTITKSVSSINFKDLGIFIESLQSDLSSFWEVVQNKLADFNIDLGSFGPKISKAINNVSSFASALLFAVIFSVYFLIDENISEYWKKIFILFVAEDKRKKLKELLSDADKVFSGYIRGQSMDALIVGVVSSIALLIAGIPYAAVVGLLTGVGNLIPYVGPLVGWVSLIIMCLSEGSIPHLISGILILAVVMIFDSNVINPRLLSNNVEVHPMLVVVALIAGGEIGGILGMLVAVPVAAFAKLQFDKVVEKKRKQNKEE